MQTICPLGDTASSMKGKHGSAGRGKNPISEVRTGDPAVEGTDCSQQQALSQLKAAGVVVKDE